MPPRRSKKPVKDSSSGSDSEHEASNPSIVSKITSKLKSAVGLESQPEDSAPAPAKKRKRASSAGQIHVSDAEPATFSPNKKGMTGKRPVAKSKTNAKTPSKPPPKRPRKATAVVAAKDASDSDSSEDVLATAPVSPAKPRVKSATKAAPKAKAATTTPRKKAPARTHTSTSASARKPAKSTHDYDSSIREPTHSSGSITPSEDPESDGSADYDPKSDAPKDREKAELDESEEEEAALETMVVGSDALDDESDFGPHKIAERAASASPAKKGAKRGSARKSIGTRNQKGSGKATKHKDISSGGEEASDPEEEVKPRRKSVAASGGRKSTGSTGKKSVGKATVKKKAVSSADEYVSDDDDEGPVVVGKIVKAPDTGRVPPGQISENTLNFLMNLQDPAKNDREWFKLHEPVFRLAEKEWVAFVEAWISALVEVDDEIPPLPPKDVIHRIYRDMRFSNDKTPYKRNFSASTSRSGRKGIFAGYHISIKPGNESLIAAGVWCPGKNELQCIRNVILRNHGRRLRQIIAEPSFVKLFGPPKPLATKKGQEPKRQSIFGAEDELKVAPAGVDKNHRDIDLLKCRSFAVVHRFTDTQVLCQDFLEKTLRPVMEELRPFVHCLNDYMTLSLDDMSEGSSSSSSSSSSDND